MRRLRRLALGGTLTLLLAVVWLGVALVLPYQGYMPPGVFVDIPHGTPARSIARALSEKGVVRSRVAFELLCRSHPGQQLQAGEYYFERPKTALEVFSDFANGRIYVHRITISEGLTMAEIAGVLEEKGLVGRQDFLAAASDPAPILDMAPRARNLEGYLFPATYEFSRRATAREIVSAMIRRFREVWASFPEPGRNPSGFPVADVVTMASLVERETPSPAERPVIAGVFYNRLRRRVALQCDPTVIYALQLAGRYPGELSAKDLRFNSPYNTYRYSGLPPGPIANPGEASLRAALYPPYVDYLYFVSDTQGGHFFSKTLAEHNTKVARYRRLLAEIARANAQDAVRKSSPQ